MQDDKLRNQNLLDLLHRVVNKMKDLGFKASEAMDLVNKMEQLPTIQERPDEKAYTMVLNMMSAEKDGDINVGLAEELFLRAKTMAPNDYMVWNAYLHVLSKVSLIDAAASYKAEDLLKEMIHLNIANDFAFSIVLHALANAGRPEDAENLLRRMMRMKLPLTETMFNTCIDAWAKCGNGMRAEKLLVDMIFGYSKGFPTPGDVTFATAVNAWAKSGRKDAGEQAERLLRLMDTLFPWSPSEECCTSVLDAWSRSTKPERKKRARKFLEDMEKKYENGESSFAPGVPAYTAVIHAYRNKVSIAPQFTDEMLQILNSMKEIQASGRPGFVLNKIVYSAAIDVIAKSRSPDAHYKALDLLREMQQRAEGEGEHLAPSTISYNTVISAFAEKGDAVGAQFLFDEMVRESSHGKKNVAPDTFTYASLLHAYAVSRNAESHIRAMNLLEKMEEEYRKGNKRVKPNTVVYTSAIASLVHSKSGDETMRADSILRRMQDGFEKGDLDVKPNSMTLEKVLQVISKSGLSGAPERATSLMEWAKKESESRNASLMPDRACYNNLLAIWVKSGRREAVDRIYQILESMSISNSPKLKPDLSSYIHLMTATLNLELNGAPKKMLHILGFLLDSYSKGEKGLKPTSQVVNLVLMSCATRTSEHAATVEAREVLYEVGKSMLSNKIDGWDTNNITFKLFLRACVELDFADFDLIESIYAKCKRKRLLDGDTEKAFRTLMADYR
jgi:pentatricopeptide repeat protein